MPTVRYSHSRHVSSWRDGGNIPLDAGFIVAVPEEDSDITANAFTGLGGNINITAQGVYGIEFCPENTSLNNIRESAQAILTLTLGSNSGDNPEQVTKNLYPFYRVANKALLAPLLTHASL